MFICRILIAAAGVLAISGCSPSVSDILTPERSFVSDRIIFGALDAGEPLICSVRLVRGLSELLLYQDRTVYDYTGWLERGGDWRCFYSDRWHRWRGGGEVVSRKDFVIVRSFEDKWTMNFEGDELELYIQSEPFFSDFAYNADMGEVELSITSAQAFMNGTKVEGRAVHELRKCPGPVGCDPEAVSGEASYSPGGWIVVWDQGGEGVWHFTSGSGGEATPWRGIRKDEFGRVIDCSDLQVSVRQGTEEAGEGGQVDFSSIRWSLKGTLESRITGPAGSVRCLKGVLNLGGEAHRVYGIAENLE